MRVVREAVLISEDKSLLIKLAEKKYVTDYGQDDYMVNYLVYYNDIDISNSIAYQKLKFYHIKNALIYWMIDKSDEDNGYYYIPTQERTLLLDKETLDIYYLPPILEYSFRDSWDYMLYRNYFEENYLIEYYNAGAVLTNLKTLESELIKVFGIDVYDYENIPPKLSTDGNLRVEISKSYAKKWIWEIVIFYEDVNINEFLFQESIGYMNYNGAHWVLEDSKSSYYYIPTETKSILIHKQTLKVHYLPSQHISTVRFQSNYFKGNYLIEKYHKMVVKTNLTTFISEEIGEESQLKIPFPPIKRRKY